MRNCEFGLKAFELQLQRLLIKKIVGKMKYYFTLSFRIYLFSKICKINSYLGEWGGGILDYVLTVQINQMKLNSKLFMNTIPYLKF